MKLSEFFKALSEHNSTGGGYQIQLNSSNLDNNSGRNTGIDIGDLYFTECKALKDQTILCFDNMGRKPIGKLEDGTNLYPQEIDSLMFIDVNKIEMIEEVKDFEDWFVYSSSRVINVYMYPENDSLTGNRNIVTIGFME